MGNRKIRSGPAVSGSPTAAERGTKSEVAHKMGKLATSPLPYRGAPPLQSGGQNQKWPTKWANWLPHPCRIGEPHRCRAGGKIRSGPQNGQIGYLTPAVSGSPTAAERGAKSEVAHKVGKLATSPLPYRGAPPLQSGGLNQKWPTKWANWLPHPCRIGEPHRCRAGGKIRSGPQSGQIGYLTPAVSGSPTAAERGTKSEVAHKMGKLATSPLPYRGAPPLQSGGLNQKWPTKWASWLPHPCRIGEPHRCRAGGKIRSGPQNGQIGYLTPAVSGSPTAAERGTKSEVAHKMGKLATSPLPYRGAPPLQSGGQNQKWPTKWANWLPHPCRIGEPLRCRAGDKIRSGPQVGKLATSPLPYRGAPPLQSGGQNQKWPTSGQIGYLTPAVSGSPTAAERGTKSEVAHKMGKLATSPLPYRGAPPLQSGALNQKWPTKWARWLPHPCRIGEPHRCRAGD